MALYPTGVFSCYTLPANTRKYQPFYPVPHQQLDFRQMRISEPSSSDESSPGTPPPHGRHFTFITCQYKDIYLGQF